MTLAEIARLAGVGRAAVSNWRRRHASFPAPIGGTDVSPHFSLTEVEAWLRQEGKLADIGEVERLWPLIDNLGDRNQAGLVVAAMALRRNTTRAVLASPPVLDLGPAAEHLVQQAITAADKAGAPDETFEYLLGRWLDAHIRQVTTTPRPLAALMAAAGVAARTHNAPGDAVVFDPACGSGTLLAAAAMSLNGSNLQLIGNDIDPVLVAVATARLVTEVEPLSAGNAVVEITTGNSLLADPHRDVQADLVLAHPPFATRNWGQEAVVTDPRWRLGLPPRGEPELAWVQHVLARLAPGGTAVIVMPPAAAVRKSGRHIRGALVSAGLLHAVVALPAGLAPPHSVGLHLWVLRSPDGAHPGTSQVHLIDATAAARPTNPTEWETLTSAVLEIVSSSARLLRPAVDGLVHRAVTATDIISGDAVLTPARYIPTSTGRDASQSISASWSSVADTLSSLEEARRQLSELQWHDSATVGTTTVGELIRAGVVDLHTGQALDLDAIRIGTRGSADYPVLMISDLIGDGTRRWMTMRTAQAAQLVTTEPNDVVIAGATRAFRAWVEEGEPTVLGPQLHILRADPERLDPWFLAGCLRAPSNGRQAGTHTSSSARIDVRKLRVLQLPADQQRQYGAICRRIAAFERHLRAIADIGSRLVDDLSDKMAAGLLDH
ncbi:N-6 DNA methylase [Nocardia sp. NPDC002869]|uniref:N-6 DNA methylase n=1 Tax=Nocardia sp. NPDC002869 TaxID=3161032 RepID=UPI00398CF191